MLSVVTPALSARLTTAERAREVLSLEGEAPSDPLLERLIDQASRAIADYCRRSFGLETVRETLRDSGDVLLSRSPVTAFASVTLDGTALLTSEYELDAATGRLYRLDGSNRLPWYWGTGLVVEYTAGYVLPEDDDEPTLPEPVERAAILLVGSYLSMTGRDPLIRSESVEGIMSTSWAMPASGDALPAPEAEGLLQPYRRIFR